MLYSFHVWKEEASLLSKVKHLQFQMHGVLFSKFFTKNNTPTTSSTHSFTEQLNAIMHHFKNCLQLACLN